MFEAFLDPPDAVRATAVAERVMGHGFAMALTGGFAIDARLRAHERPLVQRRLNDLDLVVDSFASIPTSVASDFLVHHVHPFGTKGTLLVQLIDAEQALRIDVFRSFGKTLSRADRLDEETDPFAVVAVEDLIARTTSHVCASLKRSRSIAIKHAHAFRRLSGLGQRDRLEAAWHDHRQDLQLSVDDAIHEAARLIECHPELLVEEEYSAVVTQCDRCLDYGPFHRSAPESIVRALGYW